VSAGGGTRARDQVEVGKLSRDGRHSAGRVGVVCVDEDDPLTGGGLNAPAHRGALALVGLAPHEPTWKAAGNVRGPVGRAVVDHDDPRIEVLLVD